jgi:hypothetical protein
MIEDGSVVAGRAAVALLNSLPGTPPWTPEAAAMLHRICFGRRERLWRAGGLVAEGAHAAGYPEVSETVLCGLHRALIADANYTWLERRLEELSPLQLRVLTDLAVLPDPALVVTLAARSELSPSAGSHLIRRLADLGLVEGCGRGLVRIAPAGLRSYLQGPRRAYLAQVAEAS